MNDLYGSWNEVLILLGIGLFAMFWVLLSNWLDEKWGGGGE